MSADSKLAKMVMPEHWTRSEWLWYAGSMRRKHEQHAAEWAEVVKRLRAGALPGPKSDHRRSG